MTDATRRFLDDRAELLRRPGPPGPGRRAALTAVTDQWLTGLFTAAGGDRAPAALVAVGGYGRGELATGSDLDLLVVHDGDIGDLPDRLWYPIWDSRLRLDHAVRTPAQARRLAGEDPRVLLGLLDARTIAGDHALTARLLRSVRGDWRSLAPRRAAQLRELVDARRQRFGDLAHLLEPDVKEAYGGLRELTVLRALAASWLTDIPHDTLRAAGQELLDVRDALHQVTGRGGDRIAAQDRAAVAGRLALDGDALLRRVSRIGRTIGYASDLTWYRVARTAPPARRTLRRLRPLQRRPLAAGVVVHDDEVVLAADARPELDPVLLLRAAAASAGHGLPLAPHTVTRLAQRSAPMPQPWPLPARDAFVRLLGAGPALVGVWEALDQAGVWTALLPHWDAVRSAPQHNPAHRYTVDRHLVQTCVEAAALQRRVARPDLLLVAALVHDLGKGRGARDHSELGAELAGDVARRLGFDRADTAVVVRLVRHHLLLAATATRRDPDDPATITTVVDAVGDLATLDLLAALTEADARATGPVAWTPWRAALIADLLARVRARLTGAPAPPPTPLSDEQRRLAAAGAPDLVVHPGPADGLVAITAALPDRVGAFATVAGVLAANRLDVRTARAAASHGMAVSTWLAVPSFGDAPPPQRLRADLHQALAGALDLTTRLRHRAVPAAGRQPPASVHVIDDASQQATVVEVRTGDEPGALYRVARAIADAGADITAVHADSFGGSVVDTFYLRGRDARPLAGPAAEALAARLALVVAGDDDPGPSG